MSGKIKKTLPFHEWLKSLIEIDGDFESLVDYGINISDLWERISLANYLMQRIEIPNQHIDGVITCLIRETIFTADEDNNKALKDTLEALGKKELLRDFTFNEEEYDEEKSEMGFEIAMKELNLLKKKIL